jgi:hypothetical protein
MSRLQNVWTPAALLTLTVRGFTTLAFIALGFIALVFMTLTMAPGVAWGQESSTSSTPLSDSAPQQPVPAYGQENAPAPITENPPITGLDQPGLEPHAAPLSYLQPGATVSESADSNIGNTTQKQSFVSVSRALASLTLQRLWSHYDLGLDYIGGVGYYDAPGYGIKSLQQMDLEQKITWKRGQLGLRDSFSYLPEGNFGASYGALGSQGIASLGTTPFVGFGSGADLGTFGQSPRILNVSLVDLTENLTPKSAMTAVGGYAFTHFYGNNIETGGPYINSSQSTFLLGYDRLLTSRTQVAVVAGYEAFDFSIVDSAFHSYVAQVLYGHRVSGRLDFIAGAGPQFVFIQQCPLFLGGECLFPTESETRLGVTGRVQLRYKFPETSLSATYERRLTSGSGLFAGAQTDIATFRASRPVTRVWGAFVDLGYSRNSRIQTPAELNCGGTGQPACPGVSANTYESGFAGAGVHRAFGRDFHGYATYQFNELWFDRSYCGALPGCNRIGNRQVITVGLDWTPRPIRID